MVIVKGRSGSRNIYAAIKTHATAKENASSYLQEAKCISEALPQAISIDNFVDGHAGNEKIELCAKLGVVESILQAERSSKLNFGSQKAKKINFARV